MGCSNNIKVDESTNSKNATVAVVKANKKTIQNQNAEFIQKQQEIKNISYANTQNIIQKEVNIPKTIQQNVTQNIPKTNQKTISKEEMINYKNLPNYDLFEKFINMEKVKQYLDENISQGYGEIIDGIFNDIKPLITELFKRFKIEYEIISQKKVIDCRSYQVVITPPQGTQNLDNYFPLFFMNFWFYPPEVFNRRIIKKFYFCEQLMFATSTYSQPRAACPEWSQTHSMIYAMEYQQSQYLAEVMHHELFHYLDFMISGSKVDSKVQADWETLNPKGFHYGSGGEYEREYIDIDKKDQMYFVSHYSMTDCCQDRAQVYCRLMTRNTNWYKEQSQVIKKKIEKIRNFMKMFDPTYIGNNNNYYYERLLIYLDIFYNDEYYS
jgi:hypothetical protein